MRCTCSTVPCWALKPNWCDGRSFIMSRDIFFAMIFSSILEKIDIRLIGRYDSAWYKSFPGFGIMIMVDIFHLSGKYLIRTIALNIWVSWRVASCGSSMIIRPLILSGPGAFLILTWYLIMEQTCLCLIFILLGGGVWFTSGRMCGVP